MLPKGEGFCKVQEVRIWVGEERGRSCFAAAESPTKWALLQLEFPLV